MSCRTTTVSSVCYILIAGLGTCVSIEEMSYLPKPRRNVGCFTGAAIFAFVGVPWLILFTMGERVCDMGGDQICAWSKSAEAWFALAALLGGCLLIAALINGTLTMIRRQRSRDPKGS